MKTITFSLFRKTILGLLAAGAFVLSAQARVLVTTNSTWRYFKGTGEASTPTNAWRELDFDDSAWLTGLAPFHFGTNTVGGDDGQTGGTILDDMRGNYTCIFLRQKFVINDTNYLQGLWLTAWYDDGFAVWINGQPPRNPVGVSGTSLACTNTAASSTREANGRTRLDISSAFGLLRHGTNVLCLQAFNGHLTNDDFRIDVELAESTPTLNFTATTMTVAEDVGQALLPVVRTGSLEAVTVDFATTNGTALAGQDYLATNGTLTFAQGQSEQVIAVPILNDGTHEGTETFQIKLSNAGAGAVLGATNSATVLIADNDPGFQVEFQQYWVDEGAGVVVMGVLRGDDGPFSAMVDFASVNGTATAGADYVATNGTLSFAAGEPFKLVPISILNDAVREDRETFTFSLSNPSAGVGLGSRVTATVAIIENDPGVRFERTSHWIHENESALRVTVLRGNDLRLGPFTVDFSTSNLTATAGQDYVATNGTLHFGANEMSRSFTVRVLNDGVLEADEQFQILLSHVAGDATLSYASNLTATVTLCDATGQKPHRFQSLHVSPDGTVRLMFDGAVSQRFKPFFDLYPLEVSENLRDWAPLALLVRTNGLTNTLVFTDPQAGTAPQRFYRTPVTNLITPQLPPSGPYRVGMIDRVVTNPTRRNRYGISTNGSFPISIWYPATPQAGGALAPFDEPPSAQDPGYWGAAWMDRARHFVAYAQKNARFAADKTNCPIVLQSVGGTGGRRDLRTFGEDLASHGYVVLAPDHYDSTAVVFPDGTYLNGSDGRAFTDVGLQDRVADLRFLLDLLDQWNQTDPFLAGRLDLQAVGAMGWSWGGGAVADLCRFDDRGKVAIVLDGYFQNAPALLQNGLFKPFLSMYQAAASNTTLYDKATNNAVWFQINTSIHDDFGGWGWWSDPSRSQATWEIMRTINAYNLSFLNKYLKGQDDHLLDGPPDPSAFPRVINFRKK